MKPQPLNWVWWNVAVARALGSGYVRAGLPAVGVGQPAEEVVEAAVLHHHDDDVLDPGLRRRRQGGAGRVGGAGGGEVLEPGLGRTGLPHPAQQHGTRRPQGAFHEGTAVNGHVVSPFVVHMVARRAHDGLQGRAGCSGMSRDVAGCRRVP